MPISYQELIEEIFAHGGRSSATAGAITSMPLQAVSPSGCRGIEAMCPKVWNVRLSSSSDWESRDLGGSNDVRI